MLSVFAAALLVPLVVGLVRGNNWAPPKIRLEDDDKDFSGIRCPLCKWRPKQHDRWMCDCGEIWNTFMTRGECPGCQKQWKVTNCPQCNTWSDHDAWYEDRQPRP
jgi:hypothetical protein